MKTLIIILLTAAIAGAGRTSEWSAPFVLHEQVNATLQNPALYVTQDLLIIVAQERDAVTFALSGISPILPCALKIYAINGRSVRDLSGMVHRGSTSAVWKIGELSRGVFLARLSSGNRSKTVRFIIYK